jgi:hypothetical protein
MGFRKVSGPSEIDGARCNAHDHAQRAISDGPAHPYLAATQTPLHPNDVLSGRLPLEL